MGGNSSEKPGAPEPAGPDENSTEDPNYKEAPEDGVFTKFVKTLTNQNGYQNDGSDPGFQRLNANNRYLPEITDPGFGRADFVFPLLDCRILASARSAELINQWLCSIDLYIRESPEDKGILLLSRIPLDPS
ncbi:hypothetical protein [Granulicella mallensis]|uniref:Uncharacterized protein n=1 Tax=Granulicella mallensis (strain ATCC BAA-1857 / DSM 23137 / MP5ACTX8) TaxID=682795 RepID=G8NWM4_GRAMM|nr:hypothetical protein [Granulicella mallensis]AEU38911.1 hypothetical protein AciX8_4641 [Granulicella mallensis MP5ACTX8]